jgi:hypothetical protein
MARTQQTGRHSTLLSLIVRRRMVAVAVTVVSLVALIVLVAGLGNPAGGNVWQYGHTHRPGSQPGYLANPDGVDLAPPHSLTMRFAHSLHAP